MCQSVEGYYTVSRLGHRDKHTDRNNENMKVWWWNVEITKQRWWKLDIISCFHYVLSNCHHHGIVVPLYNFSPSYYRLFIIVRSCYRVYIIVVLLFHFLWSYYRVFGTALSCYHNRTIALLSDMNTDIITMDESLRWIVKERFLPRLQFLFLIINWQVNLAHSARVSYCD